MNLQIDGPTDRMMNGQKDGRIMNSFSTNNDVEHIQKRIIELHLLSKTSKDQSYTYFYLPQTKKMYRRDFNLKSHLFH